jgi:phosphoadenosine phosphosulfate reductase
VASPLYRSADVAATITNKVLVAVSGGKESVVTLDLCTKRFARVEGFFMYYVRGLSFQENILRYLEDRYGIIIHRLPHFELSQHLRYGTFRPEDWTVPIVSVKQIYDYLREKTEIYWIAAGERIDDSIWRRAIIKQSGSIDEKRGRFFPVAEWNKQEILSYIRQHRLKTGAESEKLGFSFRSFMPEDMLLIRQHYPADYERIKAWFPFMNANVRQYEIYGKREQASAL